MLTVSQLAPLKDRDPYLYETLTKIVSAVNSASQAAGVDSTTPSPAPTSIASINVQASNGWFDVSISDPSDSRPGFFFPGGSRNLYIQLGNQTLYWRAFSQYIGSTASAPRTFGSPPTAVVGGGASGPTPQPSKGSGAFPNGLQRGGNGFGVNSGARITKSSTL